jgi:hypothetical protein
MSVDVGRRVRPDDDEQFLEYRALSTAAVASLVAGVLSLTAPLAWIFLAFPVLGLALGLIAWRRIRSRPDELAGLPLAKAGLALSAVFLICGPAWLSYQQATEVPDGYERISYEELQPSTSTPGQLIPPEAFALEGKKIFIKGYVYPGREAEGIKTFLLVRDQGDCCFGGNPKLTDRIQVTLNDPLRLTFRSRMFRLAGVFHVKPTTAVNAGGGVYYQLDADYLR